MPSLETLCCPYWTQDVGRDLTWKRQNKRLCSLFTPNSVEASLTDGNFSIYSAIQALHNLPKKKALLIQILLHWPIFRQQAWKFICLKRFPTLGTYFRIGCNLAASFFHVFKSYCHSQKCLFE